MDWRWTKKNELYHHGILGQKWGKKNGPPYPLDSSDHSSSEKKAGWGKSLSKDDKKAKKELAKAQKAWDKNFEKNWVDVYNEVADYANEVLIPQINEEYKDLIESEKSWDSPEYQAYEEEFQRRFDTLLQQKYDDVFGKRPE